MEDLLIVIHFSLHLALVTVCLMRRSRGKFPLVAVVGSFMLITSSTLGLAEWVVGQVRFQSIMKHVLPDSWFSDDFTSSLLSYSMVLGLINVLGMFLVALGILLLARQKTREAIKTQRTLHEAP